MGQLGTQCDILHRELTAWLHIVGWREGLRIQVLIRTAIRYDTSGILQCTLAKVKMQLKFDTHINDVKEQRIRGPAKRVVWDSRVLCRWS